jgi:Fe-S-cluster containining protein
MSNESEWVTGKVRISVAGQPLDMEMTVPAKPVKIRKMLPIFQQMSNSFVQMGVNESEANGEKISCQAGCGACCRQPVPISETEAFEIAELVENMPEEKRSGVKQKFTDACEHLYEIGWFERLDATVGMKHEKRQEVIKEYFQEGIPCPFLEEESCSIHQNRPLSCREYLVTSPAENCANPSADKIRMVQMPVKPSATLCKITKSENLNDAVNFVPLILSLDWADKFSENEEKRTGERWMAEFFTNLTKSEIPTNSK